MVKALRTSLRGGGLRQGGLQPGIGSDNIFATASLDLDFARHKNLGQQVDATTGSNLIDFTRASSGTYVGSDGLIKTAVTNLLLGSEAFNNASYWTPTNGTIASTTIAGPFGASTASLFVPTNGSTVSSVGSAVISLPKNGLYSYSLYLKSAGVNYACVQINAFSGNAIRCFVDLATGDIATFNLGNGIVVPGSVKSQSVGNGWWRLTYAGNPDTLNSANGFIFGILTASNLSSATFNGDGTSGLYIWGAQLEQSSTVGEYVKTTSTINSAPRFDHDPVTGESLGLLVEESRTNLALNSENLSTANWDVNGSATIASGFTSPRGDSSAYLVENATSLVDAIGNDNLRKNNNTDTSLGSLPAGTYTVSGYVKANGATTIFYPRTRLVNSGVNSDGGINISTNWQRFTRTVTATVTDSLRLIFAADSIDGFYLWGLQVEAGSAPPTSYIPTTSSTVTRAADVASISGSNFSSWYRQDEGCIFSDIRPANISSASFRSLWEIGSDNNNWMALERNASFSARGTVRSQVGGSQQYSLTPDQTPNDTWTGTQFAKIAFAYKENDFANYSSSNYATSSSGLVPVASSAEFIPFKGGHLKRFTYWPTRLSDNTLQTITQ